MRFSYLLLAAATVLLASPGVICAKQSTVASIEAATQSNSIDTGNTKRFLRSHKWIEDDDIARDAEKEERTISILQLDEWLEAGHTPAKVKQLMGITKHTKDKELLRQAEEYADAYRARYSTFNGK